MENVKRVPDIQNELISLFDLSNSTGGEQELLRVASKFSIQLTDSQIQVLLTLLTIASKCTPDTKEMVDEFVRKYLEFKQYNNSHYFIMRCLDSISLMKLLSQKTADLKMQR